ncbi:MAG TPA: acyltransferase [Blastocatellia bacterium]|nr:acyltransferase [Blastocatellia bacterium]
MNKAHWRIEEQPRLAAALSAGRIPALDGLRAVAVLLVIFYHFGFSMVPGGSGVLIFFVLSGFLITWLLLAENDRYGDVSLAQFYRRRVLRIFPAFYAWWLLTVLMLLAAGKRLPWPHALSAFCYASNYYNAWFGDPNTAFSHTWSLAIEEQFYLFWPFVFIRLRHSLRRMTFFLGGVILAVCLWRWLLYFAVSARQSWFYASFDTRLDGLMWGCLLAVLLKSGAGGRCRMMLCRHPALMFVTLALFFGSACPGHLVFEGYRDAIGLAVEPALIAALMVQLLNWSESALVRWLEWPALRWLGRLSYSLYLYQQLTLYSIRKLFAAHAVPVQLAAAVTVTVLLAACSYYLIERPFLRLKQSRGIEPDKSGRLLPQPATAGSRV